MTPRKPVVLCILDGWGLRKQREANAVALAVTPTFDRIVATSPNATLITFGTDVGLPKGQMGNSEVGHMNIGAGRVVAMDLGKIDSAIEDGRYQRKTSLGRFIVRMKRSGGTAHILGIVSDGGVHSHIGHMTATVAALTDAGVPVCIHAITDGRDVPPESSASFVDRLETSLPSTAQIATVSGRYFVMDRDNRWKRIQKAYDTIMRGGGHRTATATEAIAEALLRRETDEFIEPTSIGQYRGAKDGDGVFCLNFRADRARQIMAAIGDPGFRRFDVGDRPTFAGLLGMVEYSDDHNAYLESVFPKVEIINSIGQWIAHHGKSQLRLAETEKYPHVTFFLSGGKEELENGEVRIMPDSPDVATYDLKPEMSCEAVTDQLVQGIEAGYDLIVVNFANPDMVGHTGDLPAAIAACEVVDQALSRVLVALSAAKGAMIVTADHGNCETMIDPVTGGPHTAHTTNLVPVAMIGGPKGAWLRDGGRLADIAPTLLQLMGLPQPPEMTGQSLIVD